MIQSREVKGNLLTIHKSYLFFNRGRLNESREEASIMTIKYMEKCGEVCQRKLGAIWVALIGIVAVVAILSALLGW